MRHLRLALSLSAAAIVFVSFVILSAHPTDLPIVVAVIAGVALASGGILSFTGLFNKTRIAPGALPPLLLVSMTFANLFIEDSTVRIAIAGVTAVLFFVLVRHLFESMRTQGFNDAVLALSEWSAVMIVLGSSAGLLAAVTFLTFPVWAATLIFAAVSTFVCVTVSRIIPNSSLIVSGVAALTLTEGFFLLSKLPISYWVMSALLAAVAYVLLSIARGMTPLRVRRTLLTVGSMGALLLMTARWR